MTSAFALNQLQAGDHVCWAFDDDANVLDTTTRYVARGISAGEKVLCHLEQVDPDDLVRRAAGLGVDVAAAADSGQARFRSAGESYLSSGWFRPDDVLDGWRTELRRARDEGYPGVRVVADMSWAFRPSPVADTERLAWYEAQANRVFAGGYATVMCLYDRRCVADCDLDRITMAHHGCFGANNGSKCPQLRLRHTKDPAGVRISGEADLATRDALVAVVSGLASDIDANGEPITVDVRDLSFADGRTAQLLVWAARAAPAGMRVVGASATLAKLIDLTGGCEVPGLSVQVDDEVNGPSREGSDQA
jgi:hypothetical protein